MVSWSDQGCRPENSFGGQSPENGFQPYAPRPDGPPGYLGQGQPYQGYGCAPGAAHEPTGYVDSPYFDANLGQVPAHPYAPVQPYAAVQPYPGFPAVSYSVRHPPRPAVGFGQAIKLFFKNYAQFYGRASRREFWFPWVVGFGVNMMLWVAFVLAAVTGATSAMMSGLFGGMMVVWALLGMGLLVPSLSVTVRRLHDAGFSGFFVLLNLIPYVGWIAPLVMTCMESSPAGVKYDDPAGTQPHVD